jgi:hypothetical protein
MQRLSIIAAVLLAAALPAGGCGRKVAAIENPTPLAAGEYDRVFDAAVAELRDRRFVVARQDRRFGLVTTYPLIASSVLEPWYSDNSSFGQTADSTLNLDRRTVRVTISPAAPIGAESDQPPARYRVGVEVTAERHQNPPHTLTTSNLSPGRFGERPAERFRAHPAVTEEGAEPGFWKPIGRDDLLERRLLDAILTRAAGEAKKKAEDKKQGADDRNHESVAESAKP